MCRASQNRTTGEAEQSAALTVALGFMLVGRWVDWLRESATEEREELGMSGRLC